MWLWVVGRYELHKDGFKSGYDGRDLPTEISHLIKFESVDAIVAHVI